MARSIEQVGQDLIQLKTTSGEVGRELTAVYRSYFGHLATTLKQQSIQSCYHLCTNCYPDAFLQLNYNQRSQLLKTLQRVIGNVTVRLVNIVDPIPDRANHNDDDEPTGELTSMQVTPIDWFDTPLSLSTWQQNLETELLHRTKEISYKVNLLLQQAQIAPANIPKPILEADPEADRQADGTVNPPNILSVFIGQASTEEQQLGDNENAVEDDDLHSIIQIHSLYLRLTEVEFSDGTVLSLRKNINQLVNKVGVLRREYLQKQQELKIAEAESAWRNSWFED
jgi:hypothetical protein